MWDERRLNLIINRNVANESEGPLASNDDENQMPLMPGGTESDLGNDFHGRANIIDEGLSQETEVRESHTKYQTLIGDFHGPSLGTSGGASPIDGWPSQETVVDESHNKETPTE
ncbi:Hypothetical predicted protein [Olea europaea subsp. europaea]|uniref:Uncharacterized protein n=1 Tax=Olea europaea subsp. europaea TaxID=158383 RepID=A0A8S0TVE1_OLEEU|nr:Hypothetical predicted protein [Olea europaea subsp. europaea]